MTHGLTQAALAQRVGTTKSAISRLESGRHAPNIATLQKIARTFGRQVHISFVSPDTELPEATGAGTSAAGQK